MKTQLLIFTLYLMIGILLNIGGITPFVNTVSFLGVMVCVALIDMVGYKQGLDRGFEIFGR